MSDFVPKCVDLMWNHPLALSMDYTVWQQARTVTANCVKTLLIAAPAIL